MAMSRWLRSNPMPTANKLKAASTNQRVCQRGRRAGRVCGVDSTDEFILSTDKPAAFFRFRYYTIRRGNFQNLMDGGDLDFDPVRSRRQRAGDVPSAGCFAASSADKMAAEGQNSGKIKVERRLSSAAQLHCATQRLVSRASLAPCKAWSEMPAHRWGRHKLRSRYPHR